VDGKAGGLLVRRFEILLLLHAFSLLPHFLLKELSLVLKEVGLQKQLCYHKNGLVFEAFEDRPVRFSLSFFF
jgi:hypothetical protein